MKKPQRWRFECANPVEYFAKIMEKAQVPTNWPPYDPEWSDEVYDAWIEAVIAYEYFTNKRDAHESHRS